MTVPRRPRLRTKLLLLGAGLLLALAAGELLVRLLPARGPLGSLFYQDAWRREAAGIQEAAARGLVVPVPPEQTPRPRFRFADGASFYICYRDQAVLQRPWLDDQGCVPVQISKWGIREREDVAPGNKQPGERRIVCIGDSFTFGWGIPVEQGWVRLLEDELRKGGQNVRTVNCGAAGAIVVDEYRWGLEHRFHVFQPDVVVVTLCLNDLLPSSGLFLLPPSRATGFRLYDLLASAGRDPLALDPKVDWVQILLDLPKADGEANQMYNPDAPYDAMWSQHAPQQSLQSMRDWCRDRGIRLGVVLWPFLQGLGPGEFYPFAKIHREVASFCEKEGIPFLDLLPPLHAVVPTMDLWVTPADMHPNPRAQRLALPALVGFVQRLGG